MAENRLENNLRDIKLERQAVATVLQDESLVDTLIKKTDEDYFTDHTALEAYRWMRERYASSKRISLVRMKRETDIDVEELIDTGINLLEYDELLKILTNLKLRRKLLSSARSIARLVNEEDLELEEYGHQAQEIIFRVTSNLANEKEIYDMQEVLDQIFTDISVIQQGKKELTGLRTSFPLVDGHTSGLQAGHLTVVGGKSSMGKTAFALTLTHNILLEGKKVIFISLEMLAREIGKRLLALDSLVPTSAYNGILTEGQKRNMDASLSRLMDCKLIISDRRGLKVSDIKSICRNIFREQGRYDLIIIDYLQRIVLENSRENLAKRVGNAVSSLRDLAGLLDVPVVLLSQLNRNSRGKPSLSDLRDSGEIEENADEVWFPYRPRYAEKVDKNNSPEEAELIFAKGRTSGEGVASFIWYPSIQCWRDSVTERTKGPLKIIRGEGGKN